MAFSICSITGRQAPSPSSTTATKSPVESIVLGRRSANYQPTLWDDKFIQSLTVDSKEESVNNQIANLLEEVRRNMFGKEKKYVEQLELVDSLQQLGLAYQFEQEIHDVLSTIHRTLHLVEDDDLYATSLLFRILREHGFQLSQDVFNNFKDGEGKFRASLCNDIKSILSLYEASFLGMKGEDQLDVARDFATKCLKEVDARVLVEPSMKEKVSHALELPLHWRMQRLHTRWFIDQYERDEDMNPSLLKLAKFDFNMVQGIYKRELKEMSSWWTDLGVWKSLGFARDRLVENYFWAVGFAFEPKFGSARKAIAKANCLITVIDDIYDIYGTLEELELFTDAVERWDASATEQLPDYMKIAFMALFNTTNDTAYKTLKLKGLDVLPCLKRSDELERGDVPKAIQCYMNDNKVSEVTAREHMQEMIAFTWKELNSDRIANTSFEESFKKVALNIPRMAHCMYQHGDGYGRPSDGHGRPGDEIMDRSISILIEPIPLY